MGRRNEEWVNGCMPGLCVAFAGSNSDVKPNDRLPIIETTHESQYCKKKRCIAKKNGLTKEQGGGGLAMSNFLEDFDG